MKKILQYVPSYGYGGIESFTYELNKQLSGKCKFYYVVEKDVDNKTKNRLQECGSEIVRIPNMTKESFWGHISAIRRLLKTEKFDVVHVHDCNNRFFMMLIAKLYKVKCRIYHVHSKNLGGNKLSRTIKKMGIRLNIWFSTVCMVCSEEAAKIKKIKNYTVVNNCISANNFRFSEERRNALRKKYSINRDEIVLLFVGRVEKVKNVDFLLNVLKNIPEKKKNYYTLLIVGDGDELPRIKAMANKNKDEKVLFAGKQDNIVDYYSASDYICLPSFAEGFPIVLLEAQANGLSGLVSVNVPDVVNLNKRIRFLKIGEGGVRDWIGALLDENKVSKKERLDGVELIEKRGYDSKSTAKEIGKSYGIWK